jgi:hypothetical protein
VQRRQASLLIAISNLDLMVSSFVIEGNKKQTASRVAKIVNSIVAARDRVLKGQRDLVQMTV